LPDILDEQALGLATLGDRFEQPTDRELIEAHQDLELLGVVGNR
jgi:hypothetical protein